MTDARRFIRLLTASTLALLMLTLATDGLAAVAGRYIVLSEGTDYFGRDYATLQEVDLDVCEARCIADAQCKAFTYNLKARWCFLKSDYGEPRAFSGAISGRIALGSDTGADQRPKRRSELAFLPQSFIDAADELAEGLGDGGLPVERAIADALAATAAGQHDLATRLYTQALQSLPDSASLWADLAESTLATSAQKKGWRERKRIEKLGVSAAINAYLVARDEAERARALAVLGRALTRTRDFKPAIRATRASLALFERRDVRKAYDKLIAEHGFRITGHRVDSDTANPRVCIEFSDPLGRDHERIADFVGVERNVRGDIEVESRQICVDGVLHGERYRIRVRAGVPAADGEKLEKTADLDVYVRDRSPTVRFVGRAYVLPSGGEATLPIVSVNSAAVAATVYRIGDRGIARLLTEGAFMKQLDGYQADAIAEQSGEKIWSGEIEVDATLNREVTTAIPVGALVERMAPGAYVMTAEPTEASAQSDSEKRATQWFIVSDLGLAAFSGNDGMHVMARSLASALPLAGVELRLVAVNDEVLGRALTDEAGYARFEPGLLRGDGGNAPAVLVAAVDGDYGLLDVRKTPFDLTDRGVDGRPAPKPLDVYLVADRGVYRAGETVNLTAMVRDSRAMAITELPLTLVVRRPDGVEYQRVAWPDAALGGRARAVDLIDSAPRGTWRAAVYADKDAPALAEVGFLVEDFEPERLDFELAGAAGAIDPDAPPQIALDARFLYGAPAAGLAVEGETIVTATDRLPDYPGYRFGLADESVEASREALPAVTTGADGKAVVEVVLPGLEPITKPLEAEIRVRVSDGGGRPVERTLERAIAASEARVGIKPLFDGAVDEGGTARFEIIAIGPDGERLDTSGYDWTLSRVIREFQWYRLDGAWKYEPVRNRERVAGGTLAGEDTTPEIIEARVDWGAYELAIAPPGAQALPASISFEAGWYVAPGAVDTPDVVKVSLDRSSYPVGSTARVHIEPRFAGQALVMVVDDRLIAKTSVAVDAGGTTVPLEVTDDWGAGAYVTVMLFRPMDLAAKRMPRRAIGLAWASVDPGTRALDLALNVPDKVRPRRPLEVALALTGRSPGEEAYVTLAAVDVGILNLTRYEAPAPDDWYFGKRRLGMAVRDLYGQLIDRMQGVPGRVRSGGDAMALAGMAGPPPTDDLVAYFSGIVRVDDRGEAAVDVDLPDFNGTLRLMAMAWTRDGVGHAVEDVIVRDPVVMQASLPRFLAPGDRSRLLLDLAQVEGATGAFELGVTTPGEGLAIDPAGVPTRLTLNAGDTMAIQVPIEALAVGDHRLELTLDTPDGQRLVKDLLVPVRANDPPQSRTSAVTLRPGGDLAIAEGMLDDYVLGTGSVLVAITGAGRIDVPGVLRDLDRYPYGCAEQLTSRALPMLYLDDVALAVGMAADEPARKRLEKALQGVLAKQSSRGSFGLWGPGSGDLWLDAYVTDFLTRAREQGHDVPEVAFEIALDNLRNQLAYASDFDNGGEGIAYALYVLARNGRALIGDLRYYAETKLDDFATPTAKAQIGAALALYGDRLRADAVFKAAASDLGPSYADDGGWRVDYGSNLRDTAALLTLAAEAGSTAIDLRRLASRIADMRAGRGYTSTQENAWTLLAANALLHGAARPQLSVNGDRLDGAYYGHYDAESLADTPIAIANRGGEAIDATITVSGIPREARPAGGNGYRIERAFYDLAGRRIALDQVEQGARIVVVVTVRADAQRAARLIVDDPLPAGLEIDNPNLIRSGDIDGIPWLGLLEHAAHKEFRADRFVAAIERSRHESEQMQFAYVVRAVSPGVFRYPAALVEDMYRPEMRAWTDTGRVEVSRF